MFVTSMSTLGPKVRRTPSPSSPSNHGHRPLICAEIVPRLKTLFTTGYARNASTKVGSILGLNYSQTFQLRRPRVPGESSV
jgi:hypothetical protein